MGLTHLVFLQGHASLLQLLPKTLSFLLLEFVLYTVPFCERRDTTFRACVQLSGAAGQTSSADPVALLPQGSLLYGKSQPHAAGDPLLVVQ